MRKFNILRKFFLFCAVVSSITHVYISFFMAEICFWNSGIIFGLVNFSAPVILNTFLLFFLSIMIIFLLKSYRQYWEIILVLGIASFTNIFDRLVHGAVCDYIKLKLLIEIPIFNLSDIFISISLLIILSITIYETIYCQKD